MLKIMDKWLEAMLPVAIERFNRYRTTEVALRQAASDTVIAELYRRKLEMSKEARRELTSALASMIRGQLAKK